MEHTFKVVIYTKSGNVLNVTDICSEVKWTTERVGQPGSLDITLTKDSLLSFHEGDAVQFAINDIFTFRGYVFSKDKDEKGIIKVKVYDQIRYLKANQSYNFSGKTASEIVKKIASDFKLTTGTIEDTNYAIPSMVMDNKCVIDIITTALEKTSVGTEDISEGYDRVVAGTGIVYVFYDDCGKLSLRKASNLEKKYIIGDESAAISYSYKTSIDEDVYNYIKLVRPNSETGQGDVYAVSAKNLIQEWGFLQYYQTVDENYEPAQIKQLAKNMMLYYSQKKRTLTIKCFGIPDIRAGNVLRFQIKELGDLSLDRKLIVEKAVHNITADSYTMDLTLSVFIDVQIVWEEETFSEYVPMSRDDSISGMGNLPGGRTVKAEFTAYYPANNSMEGGFYDCKGNRLDPSKHTCAAPKSVEYGTKVKPSGTGTGIDGVYYTVTDRGGAIVIDSDGTYHIDILMSSKAECNNFGRRYGSLTIYDGEESDGGSVASGKYRHPFHNGYKVTCPFGKSGSSWSCGWHTGTDYVGTNSKNIYAICSGTVEKVSRSGSYGNHVIVKHVDGYRSLYAHLSSVSVSKGQSVTTNTKIGVEGHTGNASGSHLHLELHQGAYRYPPSPKVNPYVYIESHS